MAKITADRRNHQCIDPDLEKFKQGLDNLQEYPYKSWK